MRWTFSLFIFISAMLSITLFASSDDSLENSEYIQSEQSAFINADYYNNEGIIRANLGDYQKAIANYNEAITRNPKFAEAYFNRGDAYSELGDYQKAIADYNTQIV